MVHFPDGFTRDSQHIEILLPGRHFLMSPLNQFISSHSSGKDEISVAPVSIIRIR
jgi:hypothetical protein